MFSCREVLDRHGEYLDGALPAVEVEAMRAHLADCPRCCRYDRVLRRGLDLLARDQRPGPDADFLHTLHSQLAREDQRAAMRPASITATATLSIAAMLVLVTWVPTLFSEKQAGTTASLQAGTLPMSAAEIAWHAASAVQTPALHSDLPQPDVSLTATNADITLIDRGYSPLILEAPTAPPSYINASLTTFDTR